MNIKILFEREKERERERERERENLDVEHLDSLWEKKLEYDF